MAENPLLTFWDSVKNFLSAGENKPWLYLLVGVFAAIMAIFFLWRIFRKRRPTERPLPPELHIELAALSADAPSADPPILEFYNLPMRLAGVVLAPVGRMKEIPPPAELPSMFESVMPGLSCVVERHRPLLRCWPTQVSTRGFARAFFSNIHLPGESGKGSTWSAVAGIFKHEGTPIMLGLVLRAAASNSLGQVVVNAEHEWLGCLRVNQ